MKRLESCCFCCGVRTGALMVAGVGVVTAGINTLNTGLGLITMDMTLEHLDQFKDQAQASFYRDEITEQEYRILRSIADSMGHLLPWALGTSMALSIFALTVVILLLIGIVHKRYKLMWPWIIATAIGIVLSTLLVITSAVLLSLAFPVTFILIVLCLSLPVILLEFYCWWVVKSELDNIRETSWRLNSQSVSNAQQRQINDRYTAACKDDISPRYVHYYQPA